MLKDGFVSGYLLSTPIVNSPSRPLLALLCFRFYSLRYISCFNDRFMFQYCRYRLPNRAWWMAHSDPRMPLSCLAIGFCFYLIVVLTFFSLLALETFFDNMVTIRYTYVYPRGLKKKNTEIVNTAPEQVFTAWNRWTKLMTLTFCSIPETQVSVASHQVLVR